MFNSPIPRKSKILVYDIQMNVLIHVIFLLIITLNYGQQICLVLQDSNHFTGPMLGKPIKI